MDIFFICQINIKIEIDNYSINYIHYWYDDE